MACYTAELGIDLGVLETPVNVCVCVCVCVCAHLVALTETSANKPAGPVDRALLRALVRKWSCNGRERFLEHRQFVRTKNHDAGESSFFAAALCV